jgi:hypothetical protein
VRGDQGGLAFRNAYSQREMDQGEEDKVYVDVTDLRVQHLTELLESERRAVKLLSYFSNVDLEGHPGPPLGLDLGGSKTDPTGEMPELEYMVLIGDRRGVRPGREPVGELPKDQLTAQEVYNRTWSFDQMLSPEKVGRSVPDPALKKPGGSFGVITRPTELVRLEDPPIPAAVSLDTYGCSATSQRGGPGSPHEALST